MAKAAAGSKANGGTQQQQTRLDTPPRQLEENIFLFVPNLIGYTRVILAAASLYFMKQHPITCFTLYSFSCLLDALDGYFARSLNQATKFGAVLDMVTDRCTTSCLLCFLAAVYPQFAVIGMGLISLDLASHYMHMYASLDSGSKSHKSVDQKRSKILNLYYSNNKVLFLFCFSNELFFLSVYLLAFPRLREQWWPWVAAVLTAPLCFGKQVISVVQMVKAAHVLAEIDVEARRAQGLVGGAGKRRD
ncbi:CDP-alcohol phosphatidyltransferase-domain-containing protein [Peziza echinospora]|nr:CDP-alcohol phosphatidyltransferase-domain-containing protein [Peziza echinospora]